MARCLDPYFRLEMDPWQIPSNRVLHDQLGRETFYDIFGDVVQHLDEGTLRRPVAMTVWDRDEALALKAQLDRVECTPRISEVRCRDCGTCLESRSFYWSLRFEHECRRYLDADGEVIGEFAALTFRNADLPRHGLLPGREPVRAFLEKVRDRYDPRTNKGRRSRFMYLYCGEYGELRGRPHYHIALLGHRWTDHQRFEYPPSNKAPNAEPIYGHPELDEMWGLGEVRTRTITGGAEAAAYIAKYALKGYGYSAGSGGRRKGRENAKPLIPDLAYAELLSEMEASWLARGIDRRTREGKDLASAEMEARIRKHAPFIQPITKPGLGISYLRRNWRHMYPEGSINVGGGLRIQTPEAYDRWMRVQSDHDPEIAAAWNQCLELREKHRRELGPLAADTEIDARRHLYRERIAKNTIPRDVNYE